MKSKRFIATGLGNSSRNSKFREALIEFQNVVKLDPRDDEAQFELAFLHLKMGKADDLVLAHQALLKVVRLNPSRTDAHLELARLSLIDEQPAKARLHADAILALQPTHPDGHLIRGQSLIERAVFRKGLPSYIKRSRVILVTWAVIWNSPEHMPNNTTCLLQNPCCETRSR